MANQPVAKPSQQFFTRKQVAERYAISLQTVDKLVRSGQLQAIRLGRAVRIRLSEGQVQ